nr:MULTISPECIES: 3'-5' exonuclease [Paenibacillus]
MNKRMDFVTIDFETANSSRSSACSIGIVEISGGEITDERSWLINPEQHFDPMNISIHKITPSMVQDAPTFGELWPELLPYMNNKHVVAHNAAFDMSVLRHSLDAARTGYPAFQYYCTYLLSKKILNELPSHRLNNLAAYYGIELNHHDALEDARAAALVLVKLLEHKQQPTPAELSAALGYKPGTLYAGGYTPFSASASKTKKPGGWKRKNFSHYS